MIKNYFNLAFRNLKRNPLFSSIHLLGLSIGLTVCFILFSIVNHEFSYDRFEANKDQVYRLIGKDINNPASEPAGFVPYAVPAAVRNEVTGVKKVAAFINFESEVQVPDAMGGITKFPYRDQSKDPAQIVIAEPQYFEIFSYQWLAGDPATALSAPNQVVLSKSRAELYFGNIEPTSFLGKSIIYGDSVYMKVSGIVADRAQPTDFTFTDFISYKSLGSSPYFSYINIYEWNDLWSASQAFVELDKGVQKGDIEARLEQFYNNHKGQGLFMQPMLQEFSDIHFRYGDNYIKKADKAGLFKLLGIAIIILLIAIFNFINLTSAQTALRGKQVSMQLILGGNRGHLFAKNFIEAFMYTGLAMLIAIVVAPLCLKIYATFLIHPIAIQANFVTIGMAWGLVFTVALLSSLTTTFFPGFSIHLKSALFSRNSKGQSALFYRKGMITAQFSASLILVLFSVFITKQMSFVENKDLGINIERVYSFRLPRLEDGRKKLVLEQIRQLPGVEDACLQLFDPIGENFGMDKIVRPEAPDQPLSVAYKNGDAHFIDFYNMKVISGHNFNAFADQNEVIISRKMAAEMGFQNPEQAIGSQLVYRDKNLTCIGVVEDFHQQGLQNEIPSTIIARVDGNSLAVRIADGAQAEVIRASIQDVANRLYPEPSTINWQSLSDNVDAFYAKESMQSKLISLAAILATLISCIGLNGLFVLIIVQRTKEIAVRKLLGAGIGSITRILTKDVVRLMTISFVIAAPLSWYFIREWLQNFNYRTSTDWSLFMIVGILAITMSVVSIGLQCIPAVLRNPAGMLRKES
ncbi:MAG: ABC transporter permease [Saprospiraceae bacterium]|nr:ABC transporter permease [Saprospiraceae bacterium]